MWLVVGLGNPGPRYARTRHNVGFRVVDELARRHVHGGFRSKFGGEVAAGALSIGAVRAKAVLLKPMEYMNLSGYAVQRAAHFYDVAPESIVVIHDEIDIDFGRLRLKAGGGHGGHNGVRSIEQELGSRAFLRVRVGVGRPGPGQPVSADRTGHEGTPASGDAVGAGRDRRVSGWLLSDFPQAQEPAVDELARLAADAAEALIADGLRAAMNRFHAPEVSAAPGPPEGRST